MANDIRETGLGDETFRAVLASGLSGDGLSGLPEKSLGDLGWSHITAALSRRCIGPDAEALAAELGVLPTRGVAERRRAEVMELTALLQTDDPLPLRGIRGVRRALLRVRKDDVLDGEAFGELADTLRATKNTREYLVRRTEKAPLVASWGERLVVPDGLEAEIRRTFDATGEVVDEASPDLGRLRRRVKSLRSTIQNRLDNILKSPKFEGILQDEFVTIRDERYVLPVRAGERGDFPGIVHGQSNSGATLFIEPQELITLNNDFRMAQLDVENEIRRILQRLTRLVSRHVDALEDNQDLLTYIDLAWAGARLADDLDMRAPTLDPADDGALDLRRVRHPVLALRELEGELKVVPNDIRIVDGAHVLIVSGPNTGGKTVTLKTLGLVSLMTRAGLPIPCADDSRMPWFDRVFSDVGDEQALERDLSTFSGHVRNIASFLPDCDAGSLVLLDELFAGTDPEQGAALGRALLDELARRGCWVVVTTHLESLKTLAFEDDRFACGSVGFDVDRLAPTYALRMGVPGSSYALRIAQRLGLSTRIVERAGDWMSGQQSGTTEMLVERLEREHARLSEEREAVADELRQARVERERAEADREKLAKREREVLDAEARKLRDEVRSLRDQVKAHARALRDVASTDMDPTEARKRLEEARAIARRVEAKTREAIRAEEKARPTGRRAADWDDLELGSIVFVRPFGKTGTVAEPPTRGERIVVQLGPMRASFELTDLFIEPGSADRGAATPAGRGGPRAGVRMDVERSTDNSLDLRGATVDEALDRVDAFLDAAVRSGRDAVFIIHGHGTGALKRAVRAHLPRTTFGSDFRAGRRDEGGDGVTVVDVSEHR